jgi:thioredoxin 1
MVKKISESEFSQVEEKKAAIIDFSAEWCNPCKMLAPVLEQVSEELDGKVDFFNVDVDENMGLATRFHIASIPAIVLLKDGKKAAITVGFQPKETLQQWIESNL